MRPIILVLCFLAPGMVNAYQEQEIPIASSVVDDSIRPSTHDALLCIDAEAQLKQTVEDLNGRLFYLETHPESGYYIRWQDRQSISALIMGELTPYFDSITHARFRGNPQICLDKLKQGVKLAKSIYQANLQYRWRAK